MNIVSHYAKDPLYITGYTHVERYIILESDTLVSQSNYHFSWGVECSLCGWDSEYWYKDNPEVVAVWHVKLKPVKPKPTVEKHLLSNLNYN